MKCCPRGCRRLDYRRSHCHHLVVDRSWELAIEQQIGGGERRARNASFGPRQCSWYDAKSTILETSASIDKT